MWLVLPWGPLCWMINTVICPCRLGQVPRRGGLEPWWEKGEAVARGLLVDFVFPHPCERPEEPPQTLQGVLCAVPVSSLALAALAQQCQSLSTAVWLPAQHESCVTCPFVGSGGTLPATPHSTERPFRNSVCMGGMGWRERRGRLFKLSPNKDLLLLSVVNIDLTYFCYNSI